ncbi:MAG: hypothetical protein CVV42_14335 [Candidatus Riflebacteria bacterium HGW-Riflebacteria-2]|nr:MAG: hypothetical protein CVV42_14335 [Candidatus Riflebacteria bacterium HGW-Riflebacteria-2]
MLLGKKTFIAGFLAAAIVTTIAIDPLVIQASTKSALSPEIAFSRQLGLFDQQEFSSRNLNQNISETAFQNSLGRVLAETGALSSYDRNEMTAGGIIDSGQPDRTISRQAACETIMRSIMFSWINSSLPRPEEFRSDARFKDWQPDPKYAQALDYALKTGVIQGSSDGTFRPGDQLKLKEALWLLKRLHDLIVANGNVQRFSLFADVPQDHYMTRPLLNLRRAGAFDLTNLGRRLNGTGNISARDLGLIVQGILARLKKSEHIILISQLMKQHGLFRSASRSLLARMAEVLASAIPHCESDQQILYSDVRAGTDVADALKSLAQAGIRLGYNNNLFAGNENISRFEALGVINRIISEIESINTKALPPVPEKPATAVIATTSATNTDMEAFISRLRSKRERVRRILSRE